MWENKLSSVEDPRAVNTCLRTCRSLHLLDVCLNITKKLGHRKEAVIKK